MVLGFVKEFLHHNYPCFFPVKFPQDLSSGVSYNHLGEKEACYVTECVLGGLTAHVIIHT